MLPILDGANVSRSLDRDAGLDHVNIGCSIGSFSISCVVAPVYLETQIHYVSRAIMLEPSRLFCIPTACTKNIPSLFPDDLWLATSKTPAQRITYRKKGLASSSASEQGRENATAVRICLRASPDEPEANATSI